MDSPPPDRYRERHRALPGRQPRRWQWAALIAAGLALSGIAVYVLTLVPRVPSVPALREAHAARPSVLLSADGRPLATFRRERREPVPLARISPFVIDALLATEDRRFYEHDGVDVRRAAGAMLQTLGGDRQGASTLTQQLARNLFPTEIGRAPSLHRKLKELMTALRIERTFSKAQILESYLNTAPFLYNVVGIEMAAQTYYGKAAARLDAAESATLVGMLKGPHHYNPVINPERAQKRRNLVLALMSERGLLTPDEYRAASLQPLQVRLNRPREDPGPALHFAAHASKWLAAWAQAHGYDLHADGLVIHTTLDLQLQQSAAEAVERQARSLQRIADVEWSRAALPPRSASPKAYAQSHAGIEPFAHFWRQRPELLAAWLRETPEFKEAVKASASPEAALARLATDDEVVARVKHEKTRLETGLLAIEPATGEIKAWVGSRDFAVDQYDHVAQAERQPGSTFKPFVYAAALEGGISPERRFVDQVLTFPGSRWRPADMAAASGQPMSLRQGLAQSKNTITAQLMQEVGVPRTVALAQAMGVDRSRLDPVPSLALGTSPVTLLEMVNAYATLAREGRHRDPVFIRRITDREGRVIADFPATSRRALSAASALQLVDMLRGVVTHGTGQQIRKRFGLAGDVAGKTGTTQNNADGWFILMHPQLVAGAWVGFNDPRVTMRSGHWGQGGHNAVLVVGDFFRSAIDNGLIDANAEFRAPRRELPRPAPPQEALPEADPGAPKTSEELDQVLTGLGIDPATGFRRHTAAHTATLSSRPSGIAP